MVKTLYLHIGQGKARSTTIQHFLFNNKKLLLENDVYFPLSPGFPHHVRISAYAIAGSRNHSILHRVGVKNAKDADVFKNDFEKEFKNELKNCSASNVVLTSEFCFSLLQNEVDNLNDLLKLVAKKIKIIVYLRRQDNHWVSRYAQSIKSGYSIEKFGLPGKKQIDQILDYYSIVRRWENAFGIENIIVRPFEKIQLFESDLIKDFLKVLGLDCSSQYSLEKHLNKRIDANTMEVVRRINQYISVADSEWELKAAYTLKAAAQEISEGLPYEMSYENRVHLMKYFKVGNKKLAQ